jgi:hypothetical protein
MLPGERLGEHLVVQVEEPLGLAAVGNSWELLELWVQRR